MPAQPPEFLAAVRSGLARGTHDAFTLAVRALDTEWLEEPSDDGRRALGRALERIARLQSAAAAVAESHGIDLARRA